MSHPFYHAKSSAKRFGGVAEDYIALHEWFDQTKAHLPDVRHRAVLHSSFGIYLCQQVFGEVLVRKSDGKSIPVRPLGEQHIIEDMGFIPTVQDWFKEIPIRPWMIKGTKALSREKDSDEEKHTEASTQSETLCEGIVSSSENGTMVEKDLPTVSSQG